MKNNAVYDNMQLYGAHFELYARHDAWAFKFPFYEVVCILIQ